MNSFRAVTSVILLQLLVIFCQAQIVKTFSGGQVGEINSIAFSPDGKYIASSEDKFFDKEKKKFSPYGTIRLWDVQSGKLKKIFSIPAKVGPISFSKDNNHLVAMCSYYNLDPNSDSYDTIKIWDVKTTANIKSVYWRSSNEYPFKNYSSDGLYLIWGREIIMIENIKSQEIISRHYPSGTNGITDGTELSSIVFSPKDKYVAGFLTNRYTDEDRGIAILQFQNGELELSKVLPLPKDYFFFSQSLSFSADEKYLISTSRGIHFLWDVEIGKLVGTFTPEHRQWSWVSTFSQDGKYVACASQNNGIDVWDFKKMLEFNYDKLPNLSVKNLSVFFYGGSNDSKTLYSGKEGYLTFTLLNSGVGAAKLLQIRSLITGASKGISIESGGIPTLYPGQETKVSVSIKANAELESGQATLFLTVAEPHGFNSEPIEVDLETRSSKPLQKETQLIQMTMENGIYKVPCEVNGLPLQFIIDTGASSVSISLTEALFMLKNGYLNEDDVKDVEQFMIANGQLAEGTKVILKSIKLGQFEIKDVEATVLHNIDSPLLFGMTALQRFGKIEIDYENQTLRLGQ
jgi:aspartyl protease family protein